MTLNRVLKHQRLNRSPNYLTLALCRFSLPLQRPTLSVPSTPSHPTLNELEIPVEMVLTTLKQLDINKATERMIKDSAIMKGTKDVANSEVTLSKGRYESFTNCNNKTPCKLHVVRCRWLRLK